MQIDKELIHGKIDIIERNITFLSTYKEKIEACIDIASHIISAKGFQRAESYAEMFEILGKKDIIKTQLSKELSNMARFRNVLVHGYAKIDNSKVLVFTKEKLIDVENYIKAIIELIKE